MEKSKIQIKEYKKKITLLQNQIEEYKAREDFSKAISLESIQSLEGLNIIKNPKHKEEVTPITVLSDVHCDEIVRKSVVNGLNEYNPDICRYRVEIYFKRLLYMINQGRKAGYKIDKIVIALLGDFISGYIHEELEEENSMTPVEATKFIQELLIRGIKFIADNAKLTEIIIPCTVGNHARTTRKKRFSTGYKNSFEYLMYHNIASIFSLTSGYEHIKFLIAEGEFVYLTIYNYLNIFSHGDHFKYQGGIGGIEVPLKKWILRENEFATSNPSLGERGIDMAFMGHWHTKINTNKVRVNSSVIGYNSFGRGHGFAPESPSAIFQFLDSHRGYTLNNPIYLIDF